MTPKFLMILIFVAAALSQCKATAPQPGTGQKAVSIAVKRKRQIAELEEIKKMGKKPRELRLESEQRQRDAEWQRWIDEREQHRREDEERQANIDQLNAQIAKNNEKNAAAIVAGAVALMGLCLLCVGIGIYCAMSRRRHNAQRKIMVKQQMVVAQPIPVVEQTALVQPQPTPVMQDAPQTEKKEESERSKSD